jgi:hypothetical protein
MSAFTGDATQVMALPSRRHIATAVGALAAILPSAFCGNNVIEFGDESGPEFVVGTAPGSAVTFTSR